MNRVNRRSFFKSFSWIPAAGAALLVKDVPAGRNKGEKAINITSDGKLVTESGEYLGIRINNIDKGGEEDSIAIERGDFSI